MKKSCQPDLFWESKKLSELTKPQWEALCDGCGICCLYKLEDEDTAEIFYTNVACKMLDLNTCNCTQYEQRYLLVERCVDLSDTAEKNFQLLPPTCAYRRLSEEKKLADWHPLISGNQDSVAQAGYSVQGKVYQENEIEVDNIEEFILEKGINNYLQSTKKIKKKISS